MRKNLKIGDLEKVQEETTGTINDIIGILLAAVNDWPTQIIILDDYESEVRNFVGDEVTKSRLEVCLTQIDYTKNAWEAESLSGLIEIFSYYNHESLKEIIQDLEIKLA